MICGPKSDYANSRRLEPETMGFWNCVWEQQSWCFGVCSFMKIVVFVTACEWTFYILYFSKSNFSLNLHTNICMCECAQYMYILHTVIYRVNWHVQQARLFCVIDFSTHWFSVTQSYLYSLNCRHDFNVIILYIKTCH